MQHVGKIKGQWHAQAIDDLKKKIKDRFDWDISGSWSLGQLQLIYDTGLDIENYVDNLTGGKGQAWMNAYMSGINLALTSGRGSSIPWNIKLPGSFDKQYFAHELAHQWDLNSGHLGVKFYGFSNLDLLGGVFLAIGAVDGPGDELNTYIGGTVVSENACRFCDGTGKSYIPDPYEFTDPGTNPYGNNSTADYLADAFTYSVYQPGYVPNVSVTTWLNNYIAAQGTNLPQLKYGV